MGARRSGGAGRVVGRLALWLLVVVLGLAGVSAGIGAIFIERTLPQTSGTLKAPGLNGKVTVVRDTYGVPHIAASTVHDVIFAQGYVTAQDRLFQLEFNHRVAQGRLAEMFGPGPNRSLVAADAFLRTLDLYTPARAQLAPRDDQTKRQLQAYADGINAFEAAHKDGLPLEFSILGITPAPWQPLDSLAYGRVVSYTLDGTWNTKIARAAVLAKVDSSVALDLFPPYPSGNPTLIPTAFHGTASTRAAEAAQGAAQGADAPDAPDAMGSIAGLSPEERAAFAHLPLDALRGAATLRSLLGDVHDGLGSNDWVVDGTKTASGKPLLANDPHLGIRMPSIWYEVALRGGGLDAIGFSFPGDPGVVIGHNDRIAWGVTNVDADNTDLYLEKLDPTGHPGQYFYDREWLPLATRQEAIKVRGEAKPVTITVSATAHGPILNDVVDGLKGATPTALAWTALRPGYTFRGFFQLDTARNWDEFNAAIDTIGISQNFVYADVDGDIGYRMSGLLPLRDPANHTVPVGGSTSAHDWHGYVPQSQMPRLFNPPSHAIATANDRIVDDANDLYVTTDWDYGYRARRITDLLQGASGITAADFARFQADVLSLPASTLAPEFIAAAKGDGGDAGAAAKLLDGWDFTMTRESAAAAVYEATAGTLLRETLKPVLGKDLYGAYRGNFSASGMYTVLIDLLDDPHAPFYAAAAARDAAIKRAMADAMGQLRARLGPDTSKWRWGALHQAHFAHPLASVQPLNLLFDIGPVERPGDSVTVNAAGGGGFSADPPGYAQATVPSMRQIIDLSDFDASQWVTTTGESGQPWSAHYGDLVPLWDAGRYQPMSYSSVAVGRDAKDILTLQP